jgi:hypothetical protein
MLAVACAYMNPPGLQPNAPVVQATVPEILKQAYAMEPGTQKEIIIDHGDGLCSKVMIGPSTDEALNAFIDPDAAKNFAVPLPVRDDCREDHRRKRHVASVPVRPTFQQPAWPPAGQEVPINPSQIRCRAAPHWVAPFLGKEEQS